VQEQYSIYLDYKKQINKFIKDNIASLNHLEKEEKNDFKSLFKSFRSLELVYYCSFDESLKSATQISDNIFKKKQKTIEDTDRSYLLKRLKMKDKNIAISSPYISRVSHHLCITVAIKENNKIYFLDLHLSTILQIIGLLEVHPVFTEFVKAFYLISGILMISFAGFAIFYSIYEFFNSFIQNVISIDTIFKPVITLTLGLAIFDLAKTIIEQEVVFKKHSNARNNDSRMLTKFSTTIIVALLIESLMVVFKLAFHDSENMIQSLYLIGGVSLLITSLGFFVYVNSGKMKN